ncbi:MAG: apolipoprotein N-acyltransferase [Bacillota bacterium]
MLMYTLSGLGKFLSCNKYLLMPLLSGILLITAFPPFDQGYAAWLALLPLLATCLQVNPLRAFLAGVIFGIPLHSYLNFYLANVLFTYLPFSLALAAMIGLILYISLFYGLFGLTVGLVNRSGKSWLTAFAVPSLWLLAEYLRSLSFLAYNVGYLGYTQWNYPTLLNITAFYGYWGLPFLIVFFQIILLLYYLKKLRGIELYAVSFMFIILLSVGLLIPNIFPVSEDKEQLWVGLIQGNIEPEQIVDSNREQILQKYVNLTHSAVETEPSVSLVVWPETVAEINFSMDQSHPPVIIKAAEELDISLLYGARLRIKDQLYNSITFFKENQDEIPVYKKHRLVPFVEYFPMEQVLNELLQIDLLLGKYSAGKEITVFDFHGVKLGGVVCFESYFGDHTRLFASEGIRHLFILTNDAWFGDSIGLEQHAQAAAIRAAEMGIGVTQVANSGITISFDYRGRELFRSGKNEAAYFTIPLDLKTRSTIYKSYGDYFPAICALFLLITIPLINLRKTT